MGVTVIPEIQGGDVELLDSLIGYIFVYLGIILLIAIAALMIAAAIAFITRRRFSEVFWAVVDWIRRSIAAIGLVLVIFAVLSTISWLGVQLDLLLHPFLQEIDPAWWNCFTSKHGPTIGWLYFRPLFFIMNFVGALVFSLAFGAAISDY